MISYWRDGCRQMDTVYNPYLLVTDAPRLPISLDEVKQQLRLDSCDPSDDSYLKLLISAVSDYFEEYTNRILLAKSFRTYRDFFPPYILLRKSKFLSLVSFQYYKAGVLTTVDPATYQITQSDDYSKIIPLCNSNFPSNADCMQQTVSIVFTAGFGIRANSIPADIRMALLQHVSYLWVNRGDCGCDEVGSAMPEVSKAVYNRYRIKNITGLAI